MTSIKNWALRKVVALQNRDEEGQGLVEYGLILGLISVVAIVALQTLGGGVNGILGQVNAAF